MRQIRIGGGWEDEGDVIAAIVLALGLVVLIAHLVGCGGPPPGPPCWEPDADYGADAGPTYCPPGVDAGADERVDVGDVCAVIETQLGCGDRFLCLRDGRTCSLRLAQECLRAAGEWEDPCAALSEDPACLVEICR